VFCGHKGELVNDKLAQVLSIDFGGKEWIEPLNLSRLPDGLADYPPFAVCCRLANIEPVNTGDSDDADWLPSATEYFINMTMNTDDRLLTAWLDESLPVGACIR